ncbi:MAG: CPBP family intramembrane glutamic endopeptidase [Thermoanaerobaculales bacterium]
MSDLSIQSNASAIDATATPSAGTWRESRWLALVEMLIIALIFLAREYHKVPLSTTPFLLLVGWISLRLRRVGWRGIGLARYRSWALTLALGVGLGAALEVFQLVVTQPLLTRLLGKQPDLSIFRALAGNLKYALAGLVLAWTMAAFGEEMVWRGYILNRVADLGHRTRGAWIFSIVVVGFVFGYCHGYQGLTGIIEEGIAGLMLTAMYLGTGRNLAVPIVAHGVADTIDLVMYYFGKFPGM